MGTREAFVRLDAAVRALPGFPCCRPFPGARRCVVDDQACLQAALLSGAVRDWALDTRAALFLSANGIKRREIGARRDGRSGEVAPVPPPP